MNRINEILAEMKKLSQAPSEKAVTMWIQPIDEDWSCEFDFSNEEMHLAEELAAELDALMDFRVTFPTFPYRSKE